MADAHFRPIRVLVALLGAGFVGLLMQYVGEPAPWTWDEWLANAGLLGGYLMIALPWMGGLIGWKREADTREMDIGLRQRLKTEERRRRILVQAVRDHREANPSGEADRELYGHVRRIEVELERERIK